MRRNTKMNTTANSGGGMFGSIQDDKERDAQGYVIEMDVRSEASL